MDKGYVVGYVNVYVACSSKSGVLVGSTNPERAKFVVESEYFSDLADAVGSEIPTSYWIEIYDGKNIIGMIDFNKQTLEFSGLKYVDENNKVSLDVVADKLQKGKITPNQARVMCGLEPIAARSSVMEGHMRVWEEAKK